MILNQFLKDIKDIQAVVHFAAYSQVGESVKNPQKYYYNNVFGTLNLLNAMMEFDVKILYFLQQLQLMVTRFIHR